MDDLYNNLKIYEAEVMGSSSASQNTQNIAFVSSNITGSTNEAVKNAMLRKNNEISQEYKKKLAEEGPTNFALMAYISSGSFKSSSSDTVGVYKACLESVDARLDVFEEEIKILKLDMSPGTMVYQ
ncbi:hypothetical protein Tco_0550315 [Tanacetum coccineum]